MNACSDRALGRSLARFRYCAEQARKYSTNRQIRGGGFRGMEGEEHALSGDRGRSAAGHWLLAVGWTGDGRREKRWHPAPVPRRSRFSFTPLSEAPPPPRNSPSHFRGAFMVSPHLGNIFVHRWRRGSAAEADRSSDERRNDERPDQDREGQFRRFGQMRSSGLTRSQ